MDLDQHVGIERCQQRLPHAHDLVGAVDGALGELYGQRRCCGHIAGQCNRLVELLPFGTT